ncbi:replication initiation protein [Actinoplanes siamensis]|uniref:Replication initiation protein n=2 Tax=Actinoplanes siamensis TaxID=1223317 RepID=A0A919NFB4_9ACTN|nr:replication initiation protein [Actinoplanes siamensis]
MLPGPDSRPGNEQEPTPMMPPHPGQPVDAGGLLRVAAFTDAVRRAGACGHPIHLSGTRLLVERDTGRLLDDPAPARITVRCRSRRATVCPSCAALYRLDAFHLIAAGLCGGKDTPTVVAGRPRLFVTLTAPSFGPVHLGPGEHGLPRLCHPNDGRCGRWHPAGDPLIGTPLDVDGYDYAGQILFNAHVGRLWARFTVQTRRALASGAGLSRAAAAKQVRVVFAKVAEFQTRGVVHLHAVIRLDGPAGPTTTPARWATTGLLTAAIRIAVPAVEVRTPACRRITARRLVWGSQLDIRPITTEGMSERVVAGYVAKYATKAAETAGAQVGPLFCRTCTGRGTTGRAGRLCHRCGGTGRRPGIDLDRLSGHTRWLIETCWWLGGQPELAALRLRHHAHLLGFRGHFATKSRAYSTTFTALRAERQHWASAQLALQAGVDPAAVAVLGDWRPGVMPDER